MRVLVCGGRDYDDRNAVFRWLDANTPRSVPDQYGNDMPLGVTIIHGCCPTGTDRWADEWAVVNWCNIAEYPADWRTHGRTAGPIRNQRMIDDGKPDLVVAFPGGRGTADMVRRAEAAGIPVERIA
jgi:hypothetical protein